MTKTEKENDPRVKALVYWRTYYRSPGDDPGAKAFCCAKLSQILGRTVREFGRTFEAASEDDLRRIWLWMENEQIIAPDEELARAA